MVDKKSLNKLYIPSVLVTITPHNLLFLLIISTVNLFLNNTNPDKIILECQG